jgi:hypothetical protein
MRQTFTRFLTLAFATGAFILAVGCGDSTEPDPRLEENGLTREINELVPPSLLSKLQNAGMPIYTGATPPLIEGVYIVEPFELVVTTVPNDSPVGTIGSPLYVEFSNQNNSALTIVTDYVNGPEVGSGLGSFIVGNGNYFTVFVQLTTVVDGNAAQSVAVISGSRMASGLASANFAIYMINDNGDPGDYYIPNETGRRFHDQNGVSPAIPSLPGFSLSPATHHRLRLHPFLIERIR